MRRKKRKGVKKVEQAIEEEIIEKPLTEYQIADRADKEESAVMRVVAIVVAILSFIVLIIACIYEKGII